MNRVCVHGYDNIISVSNLLNAWGEFVKGKKYKKDVSEFALNLSKNTHDLYHDLKTKTYTHGDYEAFNISDPKPRRIHKATVRDRILHRAIYRQLYPYFDSKFIYDSYSCRLNKGTHRALDRFNYFANKVSKNDTKTVWVLKCDIKKFFDSIDQQILLDILRKHIQDTRTIWLLNQVISSFHTQPHKGLPLGNLTSQLFVNIYMNEFDQYLKHKLKIKYYIRYADDFVVFSGDKKHLEDMLTQMREFLRNNLKLELHPSKVSVKTLASGIDFLGWVHFPKHRVLRTTTKRRMFKNVNKHNFSSYAGLLSHGNSYSSLRELEEIVISRVG